MPRLLPENLSWEERINILRSIGVKASSDFDKSFSQIDNWFKEYDPLYLLSYCAFYYVAYQEGLDPELGTEPYYPHHILEILQAVSLCQERHISARPLLADAEKQFRKETIEMSEALTMRRANVPIDVDTEEKMNVYRLRTEMMNHTAAIRNWAYLHQMKEVVFEISKLIDEDFKKIYGVSAYDLMQILFRLTEQRQDALNEHRDKIRSFIRRSNYKDIVEAYNQAFPDGPYIDQKEADDIWSYVGKNKKYFASVLISYTDLNLEKIYSFNFSDAEALLSDKASSLALKNLLNDLSYSFGELGNLDRGHLLYTNPIRYKPFIKLEDDRYYSAIWGIFPHISIEILEKLIWDKSELIQKYTALKSKYLENRIAKNFEKAFPSGTIYTGSLWKDPSTGVEYENDLTLVIDGFAIVVEAKSGSISDPAKRGAENRLFETLRELIEVPSEQALRFIAHLKASNKMNTFATKDSRKNIIDSSKIKYYIPLGITFSHLGMIGSNLKKIIEAKITNKTIEELVPSINFTDLESIFAILSSEIEKIHYLARRREFEGHVDYEGDELDLLSFYLGNGFNIGDDEYASDFGMNIGIMSKQLDPYFIGTSEGKDVPKPQLEMTKWWRDILNRITYRKNDGWIETGFILLNTAKDDQSKLEKSIKKLISRIKRNTTEKPHNWVSLITGQARRKYVISGYPYTTNDVDLRNTIISEILDAPDSTESRGILVIGMNIDKDDYPYSVLARKLSTALFDSVGI